MSRREMRRAAQRVADRNTARIAALPTDQWLILTVTAVAAAASPNGNAVITLTWRDQQVTAKDYLTQYTPAVGDRVLCALVDNQLVVLGDFAG